MANVQLVEQLTGLTSGDQISLGSWIVSEHEEAGRHDRRTTWKACYDAFNLKHATPLKKVQSWLHGIRIFMPTIRTIVGSVEPAMTNLLLSNKDYIKIESDPILEDYYTQVLLDNNNFSDDDEHEDFETNTQQGIIQATITGDTYSGIRQTGPYFECKTISLTDIAVSPLKHKINTCNKFIKFLKCPYDLKIDQIKRQIPYFDFEDLEETVLSKDAEVRRSFQKGKNPYDRGDYAQLGEGLELIEAKIYYKKLDNGTEISNAVCTVVKDDHRIIRFEGQINGQGKPANVNDIFHTQFSAVGPNIYYGTGLIEPNIPSINYKNSLMIAELAGLMLDSMRTYTYNVEDERTRIAAKKGKLVPGLGKFIGVGRDPQINLLERGGARRSGFEFYNAIKQEMIEVSNSNTGISGVNSIGGFPESKEFQQLQFNANSTRLQSHARWWDRKYLVEGNYRIVKEIQKSQFDENGQPIYDLIAFRCRKIGWSPEKIAQKIYDPRFIQALAVPIEFSAVKAMGAEAQLAKQQDMERLNGVVLNARPEQTPFIKWGHVTREQFKQAGVSELDKAVVTEEEEQQQQQQKQEQNEQLVQAIQILVEGFKMNPNITEEEIQQAMQVFQEITGMPFSMKNLRQVAEQLGISIEEPPAMKELEDRDQSIVENELQQQEEALQEEEDYQTALIEGELQRAEDQAKEELASKGE